MDWSMIQAGLKVIQHAVSLTGVIIIFSGVLVAFYQYGCSLLGKVLIKEKCSINTIRLNLGRTLILGLEFIVAADLIGTTTTPDYYAVGILAIIVLIRTLLSYSLNRELMMLSKET